MNASTMQNQSAKPAPEAIPNDYVVLGDLYKQFMIGILLSLAHRVGAQRGADVVFRSFRRQQREKFLPGLDKLGLRGLPHAVACAQYHYLANALGGVKVEWIPESDRKSWVRFPPPRWMYDGVAICGIPSEMSRATMRGWHSNNGVLLGNLRLGFVCTSQTTDGGAGLTGYYIEEEHELSPEERLRFAPGEKPPATVGRFPTVEWDEHHRAKVMRNYSMEYVRSLISAMCEVLGPAEAGFIGHLAGRQIGMQFHDSLCAALGHQSRPGKAAISAARLLERLALAHGDKVSVDVGSSDDVAVLTQETWRFGSGLNLPREGFDAWCGLWEGLAAVHGGGPGVTLLQIQRPDFGDPIIQWRLR